MRTKSEKSIIQGIFSLILLIALFFPWMHISFMGESLYSVSFFEAINSIAKLGRGISHLSDYTSHPVVNYAILLYMIPFLYIANIVCQWIGKFPALSFYFTIIPIGIAYGMVIYLEKSGLDSFEMAGAGLLITLFVGALSILLAWINIGWEYRQHKKYLIFVVIWVIFSILFTIFSAYIGSSMFDKIQDTNPAEEPSRVFWILYTIFNVISAIGTLHLPFLVFGGILMLISMLTGSTSSQLSFEESVVEESTKVERVLPICPHCAKKILETMRFCPYCGLSLNEGVDMEVDKNESQMTEVKDDTLRYAPPEYRKEDS